MKNNQSKANQSKYNLIIGILAHSLLVIYSLFFIKNTYKNKIFVLENILFIIGHILIIVNLIKTIPALKNNNYKNIYDYNIKENDNNNENNDNDNNLLIYHSIGHLFLFLFGIILTYNEFNKISKLNNGFNIIYTLNQLLFTILLFLLNYKVINLKNQNIINFLILLIFIIYIIFKIDISYKNDSIFFNKIPLYSIIIYLISSHGSLL